MARRKGSMDSNGTTITVDGLQALDRAVEHEMDDPEVVPTGIPPTTDAIVNTRDTADDSYVRAIIVLARGNDKPDGKLAEAALEFVAGALDAVVVCGFTVWEDRRRGIRISGPGRKWTKDDGKGGQKNAFYPFVRSADPDLMGLPANVRRLIASAYHAATAKAVAG